MAPVKRSSQSGMYLILMAVIAVMFLGLAALAIGLGHVAFNRTLQQNIVNLAALAALEKFVATEGETPETRYVDKTTAALDRAREILNANSIAGTSGALGTNLGMHGVPLDDGELVFGNWYESPVDGAPCDAPCFHPNSPPTDAAPDTASNAVKIVSRTRSNRINVPFGKIFGMENAEIESSSLAVIAPRCIAMLLDVSGSIVSDTHLPIVKIAPPAGATPAPPAEFAGNQFVVTEIQDAAAFAMRQSAIDGNCASISNMDELFWCNTQQTRDLAAPVDSVKHYQSDYELRAVNPNLGFGSVLVDTFLATRDDYLGPEPYSSIFNAFNAGLRLLAEQGSTGDQVMMLVFSGDEVDRLPRPSGMTSELDLPIQLTNLNNIGRRDLASGRDLTIYPELTPNAVYEGWFPLTGESDVEDGTNLVFAIQSAIAQLSDPAICPETAKKIIILASDGLANCTADVNNVINCENAGAPDFSRYLRYVDSRAALLGTVLNRLKEDRITFSVMMAGDAVRPNFINRLNPDYVDSGDPDDPAYFLNQEQAIARGFGGALKDPEYQFFDGTNIAKGEIADDPKDAFDLATIGASDSIFADPNLVLGELAFQTGGVFCPLLRTGERSRYTDAGDPPVLKRSNREVNGVQTEAIEYRPLGEAAALCVLKSVGNDPYALRYEYSD